MKAPIFTPVKYDMQTDVDFKSYKRKCSKSSEMVATMITIYELSLRFRL